MNETIAISDLDIDLSSEEIRRARKARLPTINAISEVRRERSSLTSSSATDDAFTLQQLSLDQPIWTGGRIGRAINSAKARASVQDATKDGTIESVLIDGGLVILELERTRGSFEIRKNLVTSLQSQVDFIQTRFELGQLTRTDLSQSEARLLEAQRGLALEGFNVSNAELAYQALFGETPVIGRINLDYQVETISLPNAVRTALSNNPEMRVAKARVEAAQAELAEQKVQLRPQVDVSLSSRAFQDVAGIGDFEDVAILGRVTIPLYDGGINRSQTKSATIKKEQSLLSRTLTQRRVTTTVEAAWRGLDISKKLEILSREEVEKASRAHSAALEEQKLERRSTFEVLALEQRLLVANLAYLEAKLNVVSNALQLDSALGRLAPSVQNAACR